MIAHLLRIVSGQTQKWVRVHQKMQVFSSDTPVAARNVNRTAGSSDLTQFAHGKAFFANFGDLASHDT